MKAKYIGKDEGISLTKNKIYEALGYECGFIRIVDNTDEDYLYDPDNFIIIESDEQFSNQ